MCKSPILYIIQCGNRYCSNRLTSQVLRQLVRSAVICCVYFRLSSVCCGLWDVGSYPTPVNLACYCGSWRHLSLVCNFHVYTLELSFLGTEPEPTHVLLFTNTQTMTLNWLTLQLFASDIDFHEKSFNNIKSEQSKSNSLIKNIILYCMPGVFCARVGAGVGDSWFRDTRSRTPLFDHSHYMKD